ncbi:MAG TPA: SRPBCC family protein [Thermoplasmata archaeon]|nr:SRPBCC family protein [Thermoplasmata archaeon]
MALELKADLPATPEEVFSVLTDPNQAPQWMPAVQKVERLDDRPFGVGTSWRETRRAGKRTMVSTIRVVACDRASTLGLRVESDAMEGDLLFHLTATGPGTNVRYTAQMKGRGMMRLMTGTINRMMAQEDADLLQRLEAQVAKTR